MRDIWFFKHMWLYSLNRRSGEPTIVIKKSSHCLKWSEGPHSTESRRITSPCKIWDQFNNTFMCWLSLTMRTLLSYYPWAESPFHISAGLAMDHHWSVKSLLPISNFDRLSDCFLIWSFHFLSANSTSDKPQYGRSAKTGNQPSRRSQSKSAQETKHSFQKSVRV